MHDSIYCIPDSQVDRHNHVVLVVGNCSTLGTNSNRNCNRSGMWSVLDPGTPGIGNNWFVPVSQTTSY